MNDSEKIKAVEDKLYSRGGKSYLREHELQEKSFEVKNNWQEEALPEIKMKSNKGSGKFVYALLIFAIFFFVGAGAFAFFSIIKGTNSVSSDNLSIEISGPLSIAGGEKLPLDISVTNKNKSSVRLVELIVEYPEGTRRGDDSGVSLNSERILIGDMEPGQSVVKEVEPILFGEERSVATINMTLEYRLPNSNSIFEKTAPYQISLNSNPISLIVDSPRETISGQMMQFTISVRSNVSDTLKNVLVEAEYPPGFSFVSSNPESRENQKSWKLGDIPAGERRDIVVRGTLTGENQDARTFRFQSGLGSDRNPEVIANAIAGFRQEIAISKPFMSVDLALNGKKESEVSIPPSNPANLELYYTNNLPNSLRDVRVEVAFSGSALDERNIEVDRGFYQSSNNIAYWSSETNSDLNEVLPGESGVLKLTLRPNASGVINPEIKAVASVFGTRGDSSGSPDTFRDVSEKRILVQSKAVLTSKVNYYSGPLKNTGGVPPTAEKETTYTVTWRLTNSTNDLVSGKVVASLPSYVRYIGESSPSGENISASDIGGNVVWDVGALLAGTGYGKSPREVSFKVGITPSLSQIGLVPVLVNQATFSAEDRFAKVKVEENAPAQDTKIADVQYKSADEIVIAP